MKKVCFSCGQTFLTGMNYCPHCLVGQGRYKKEGQYVVVFRPFSEFEAHLAKGLLESMGLKPILKSYQIAMYDDIETMMEGAWGEILVHQNELEKALNQLAKVGTALEEAESKKSQEDT